MISIAAGAQTTVTAGDMVITSKLMTFHKNIYVARGGIKAEQKDMVMTADRGIYDCLAQLLCLQNVPPLNRKHLGTDPYALILACSPAGTKRLGLIDLPTTFP